MNPYIINRYDLMKNPVKKLTDSMGCEAICSCPQNPVIYPTLASIRQTIAQIQKFSHKNDPLN
jgi:hypothetical protein